MNNLNGFLQQEINEIGKVSDLEYIGLAGYTALVRISQDYSFQADVPTNFLEDGSFANDQVINKPLTLNISGQVAEVFKKKESHGSVFTRTLGDKVGVVKSFLPAKTQTQLSKIAGITADLQNKLAKANQILATGNELFSSFGDKTESLKKQQDFINQIEKIYKAKQMIKIEMPFKVFKNMILTSINFSFDNQTRDALSFKITAQEIKFAKTKFTKITNLMKNPSSNLGGQTSNKINKGLKKPIEKSFLSTLF